MPLPKALEALGSIEGLEPSSGDAATVPESPAVSIPPAVLALAFAWPAPSRSSSESIAQRGALRLGFGLGFGSPLSVAVIRGSIAGLAKLAGPLSEFVVVVAEAQFVVFVVVRAGVL